MKVTSNQLGAAILISFGVACTATIIMELYGAIQRQREADKGYGR